MFLLRNNGSRRVATFCVALTLAVGWGYRLHAENKTTRHFIRTSNGPSTGLSIGLSKGRPNMIIGASNLSPQMIDAVQNRYAFFPTVWRRWPGAETARPKKQSERRPEDIPPPRGKPDETTPDDETPNGPLPFPPFPLDDLDDQGTLDDVGPQKLLSPRPFPGDANGIPSGETLPLDLLPDTAPVPPDALKQGAAQENGLSTPLSQPKIDLLPEDTSPSFPNGGAAAAPRNRHELARRFPPARESVRDGRYVGRSLLSQSQASRTRVLQPLRQPRQRSSADRPMFRSNPQSRYNNPLRSGTRTAIASPPRWAVPAAAWSARGDREARRAEPIRTTATPRFNPLRP